MNYSPSAAFSLTEALESESLPRPNPHRRFRTRKLIPSHVQRQCHSRKKAAGDAPGSDIGSKLRSNQSRRQGHRRDIRMVRLWLVWIRKVTKER